MKKMLDVEVDAIAEFTNVNDAVVIAHENRLVDMLYLLRFCLLR